MPIALTTGWRGHLGALAWRVIVYTEDNPQSSKVCQNRPLVQNKAHTQLRGTAGVEHSHEMEGPHPSWKKHPKRGSGSNSVFGLRCCTASKNSTTAWRNRTHSSFKIAWGCTLALSKHSTAGVPAHVEDDLTYESTAPKRSQRKCAG